MDRAFKSGASGTPPTAPVSPSVGYPTSGNPGTATPATKPGPWWYHMMTEEMRAVIVAAGITPDQTNTTQLRDAILALIAAGAANDYKASVRVATTANIASLTGGAPDTVDGITLVLGDRVLVKDQSTGSQNGIYTVTTLGTGANGTWTRATDADAAGELTSGALVPVEVGTANADSLWMLTTDGTITIGTTALAFARQGASGQSAGEVCYFARNTAPTGFLKANGALVSRATYANLFAAIGTTFGVGDGSTTFGLPDLRAEFIRGWDDARGVDSGRAFGSTQADAFQGHDHSISLASTSGSQYGFGGTSSSSVPLTDPAGSRVGPTKTDGTNGTPRVAAETRPRNVALLACIKY
jgi:phage-related tail fiber protein